MDLDISSQTVGSRALPCPHHVHFLSLDLMFDKCDLLWPPGHQRVVDQGASLKSADVFGLILRLLLLP